MPNKVLHVVIGMLVLAVMPVPYGYFSLLRLITTAVFVWAVLESHRRGHPTLPWIFAGLALLFNPVIKVHFSREVWKAIDLAAAIFLYVVRAKITRPQPSGTFDGN
jgi:hypothetical protein